MIPQTFPGSTADAASLAGLKTWAFGPNARWRTHPPPRGNLASILVLILFLYCIKYLSRYTPPYRVLREDKKRQIGLSIEGRS